MNDDANWVEGEVNGMECIIAPDTGAELTVVPGDLVYEKQMLDDWVKEVKAATGAPVTLQLAEVPFVFEDKEFVEEVAVARTDMVADKVLFAVPMDRCMARDLLLGAVACSKSPVTGHSGDTPDTQSLAAASTQAAASAVETQPGKGGGGAEESASVMAVTRAQVSELDKELAKEEEKGKGTTPPVSLDDIVSVPLIHTEEVADVEATGGEDEVVKDEEAEWFGLVVDEDLSLGCPGLRDTPEVETLKDVIKEDTTLTSCRQLADEDKLGYSWKDGLLMHGVLDEEFGLGTNRLVLQKCRRWRIVELSHDKTGHVGIKKLRCLLNKRFTWPGLGSDVVDYVKSCDLCARYNKAGNGKVSLLERMLVTEPYQSVAIDLVGPLPKAKRGVRFLLTYFCMETRWPDAVPLRTVSAPEVAEALCEIFHRTRYPDRLLSDKGSVFLGKVMKRVSEVFDIDTVTTAPYRPQRNGVIERFHGTLKPMLAKAVEMGVDWSAFLPMALSAIRQVENRDTGHSPQQLVHGCHMRGPLDILYAG